MMCDYVYVINWEILRSGKVREKVFFNKIEFDNFVKHILANSRYKLLEAYKLDLVEL